MFVLTKIRVLTKRPIVHEGDKVKAGDVIADGASTCGGELSLGKKHFGCLYALGRL